MALGRMKLALLMLSLAMAPAHGQEIADINCVAVKAAISKLNAHPSFLMSRAYDDGVMEFLQVKDVSYRRWNNGPWIVYPRVVFPIRNGSVDLVRNCWTEPGLNGAQTVLRYERYDQGYVTEFHSWLDNAAGVPAKTVARDKFAHRNGRSWVTTFSYDSDLAAPKEWQSGLP
jgi:hypothetical protein